VVISGSPHGLAGPQHIFNFGAPAKHRAASQSHAITLQHEQNMIENNQSN
jgi:hypothetical protein